MAKTSKESMARVYAKNSADLANMVLDLEKRVASGDFRSMGFGCPEVDEKIFTAWGGRFITVVARPSHWKTSFLVHLARVECQYLMQAEGEGAAKKYVLFVTLEEDEEGMALAVTGAPVRMIDLLRGEYSPEVVRQHARKMLPWPLWTVGVEPRATATVPLDEQPRLTVDQIYREIAQIERDHDMRPSLILVDYLQIMDIEAPMAERHNAVGYALRQLRRIGKLVDAPVVLAVQAKESVDNRCPPIPEVGDAYYSSEVAHASDVMLSLWMPHRTPEERRTPDGRPLRGPRGDLDVQPNHLLLRLLKQRNTSGRAQWWCEVDFAGPSFAVMQADTDYVEGRR